MVLAALLQLASLTHSLVPTRGWGGVFTIDIAEAEALVLPGTAVYRASAAAPIAFTAACAAETPPWRYSVTRARRAPARALGPARG